MRSYVQHCLGEVKVNVESYEICSAALPNRPVCLDGGRTISIKARGWEVSIVELKRLGPKGCKSR